MAAYVLYCLDGIKLVRCERFTDDGDEAAIKRSILLQGSDAAELWCGGRRVKVFSPVNV